MISHGSIKLWLVVGLWRSKLAYYPAAIALFGLFILYQLYRYSFMQSLLLLRITIVDVIVIWLIGVEFRNLRQVRRG